MHSWGLYNGRYGLSKLVLLDNIAAKDRPLADKMLNGELDRQKRLKAELATDPETRAWLDERKIFQNYKACSSSTRSRFTSIESIPANGSSRHSKMFRFRGNKTRR